MTTDTERAEFEAWAQANDFCIHRDDSEKYRDYHRATTRWAWLTWQAARASKAGEATAEAFMQNLLWDVHPTCCGSPVVGAEYMGSQEMVCCGNPDQDTLNDAQIVLTLRAKFPCRAAHPTTGDKK